jgi:hypothetical protein
MQNPQTSDWIPVIGRIETLSTTGWSHGTFIVTGSDVLSEMIAKGIKKRVNKT